VQACAHPAHLTTQGRVRRGGCAVRRMAAVVTRWTRKQPRGVVVSASCCDRHDGETRITERGSPATHEGIRSPARATAKAIRTVVIPLLWMRKSSAIHASIQSSRRSEGSILNVCSRRHTRVATYSSSGIAWSRSTRMVRVEGATAVPKRCDPLTEAAIDRHRAQTVSSASIDRENPARRKPPDIDFHEPCPGRTIHGGGSSQPHTAHARLLPS